MEIEIGKKKIDRGNNVASLISLNVEFLLVEFFT